MGAFCLGYGMLRVAVPDAAVSLIVECRNGFRGGRATRCSTSLEFEARCGEWERMPRWRATWCLARLELGRSERGRMSWISFWQGIAEDTIPSICETGRFVMF